MDNILYHDGTISVDCKECGPCEEIPATWEAYGDIIDRARPIQDILPDVRPEIREMFRSGWCDVCFKLSTSLMADEDINEILGHAVRLGLLSEEERKDVMDASALYLDPQRYLMDMLTELEWCDGSDGEEDLSSQLTEFRQKILDIYDKAMHGGNDE